MDKGDPRFYVDQLETVINPTSPPVDLHLQVARIALAERFTDTLDDALELVEPLLVEIRQITRKLRLQAESEGVTWSFELFGYNDEMVRGASFKDPSMLSVDQDLRMRRAHSGEVLESLQALNPLDFERACTTVLLKLGCAEPHTSPARNDGGIDFYGRLELRGRLDNNFPLGGLDGRANVWLVGQAKHYPRTPVSPAIVREMVGSVELARTGGAIQSWEGLSLRPFDAVVILVFTTGTFSPGATSLITKSGILSMNGKQLATFVCDVGVGFSTETQVFCREAFRREICPTVVG